MRKRGGSATSGVLEAGRVRLWVPCLGAVATACLVGGLEVNPELDARGGGSSGGGGSGSNTAGSAGKPGVGDGGKGIGDGGAPVSSGGQSTSPGGGGDDTVPVGGDGPLGGAGGPNVGNCTGYAEQDDAGNAATAPEPLGSAELTGQALGTGVEVCGQLDTGHFSGGTVDVDSYRFDVPQAGEAYLSLELAADTQDTELIELTISSNGGPEERVRAIKQDARWWAKLPAGYATVSVAVSRDAALTKPRKYLLRAKQDNINVRCPAAGAGDADATATEARDGTGNTGNDVIRPAVGKAVQELTAATTDAPEASLAQIGIGQRGLITGSLAGTDHGAGDAYRDGDMYEIQGQFTDQLTFRVDWPANNADLDLWVFREDDLRAIAHTSSTGKTGPEVVTISTEPLRYYWVWVGATTQSTGLPKTYSLTVCGEAS